MGSGREGVSTRPQQMGVKKRWRTPALEPFRCEGPCLKKSAQTRASAGILPMQFLVDEQTLKESEVGGGAEVKRISPPRPQRAMKPPVHRSLRVA